MKLEIKGFIEMSMLDWDGKIVSTIYLPKCNFRCPFCQNAGLVLKPEQYNTIILETIKNYLSGHKGGVDGVCISGGEPCLYDGLEDFIKEVKNIGMLVKLDTNGSFPKVLKKLIDASTPLSINPEQSRRVDYVAMDIKGPLEEGSYAGSCGVKDKKILENVKESIKIIMGSGIDYEFRTTVVPGLHKKEDILKIAKYIKGAKKYALQNFRPQNTLDPEYLKIKPYSAEQLNEMCDVVSRYVKNCVARGT